MNNTNMKKIDYSTYKGFVRDVTEDCLNNLKEEDKEYIREHPYALHYHFGFSLFIRNHYIHGHELKFVHDPDDLSETIMDHIISRLTEYDNSDPFYWRLYSHEDFLILRREYKKIYGEYPVKLISKYHELYQQDYSINEDLQQMLGLMPTMVSPDLDSAFDKLDKEHARKEREIYKLINELAELVWKTDSIKDIASSCRIDQANIERNIQKVKELFAHEKKYIPMTSVLLPYRDKIGEALYDEYRRELLNILDDTPELIDRIDKDILRDRELVKSVLKHSCAMRYLPDYQDDDEMVRYAIKCNGRSIEYVDSKYADDRELVKLAIKHSPNYSIMYLDCLKKYRKDTELVYLACRTDPWNYTAVDPLFRDDRELAYMIMSSDNYNQSISHYLSDRLKRDKDLALLEANSACCSIEVFSDEIHDDDEIATTIMANDKKRWQMHYMSDRLKKKYGIDFDE